MRFGCILLLAAIAAAQDISKLEASLDRDISSGGIPGAAMVMIREGKVVWSKASGLTSVEEGRPVTLETLFRLGSTAKMFTAAAVLSLADAGKLKLDAPIGNYAAGLHPRLAALTLHQLLTHTAGLADDAPMDGSHDEAALAAAVRSWKETAFFAEPGAIFSYANTGYVLAGYVIEQVTGKPFATAIEDLVLRPAGMLRSTYRPLVAMTFPLALGHAPGPTLIRPFADHAGAWPPGSLFTTANDLARFVVSLMDGPLWARLSAPLTPIPGTTTKYGYGLLVSDHVVMHSGARAGYGSSIHFIPAKRAAVIQLANRTGALMGTTVRQALSELISEPPPPAAPRQPLELSSEEASRYAGHYVNGAIIVDLAVREGRLVATLRGKPASVVKVGDGRFHIPNGGELEDFWLIGDRPRFLFAALRALRRMPDQQ
jgi:CubicO group peptidase (beta-lactamase class C family)